MQRLNTALYGSNLILVDVDPDGVVYLSERWNELLGGEAQETYTTFDALMALTHDDERDAILREYVDVAHRDACPSTRSSTACVRTTARWRWIRSRGRVVERDAHGRARRLAGINEDITARKQAEERVAPERVALPQPARAVVRLVLGAGRGTRLHRSRPAWTRSAIGSASREFLGRGRGFDQELHGSARRISRATTR